jgi:hypothetical protein
METRLHPFTRPEIEPDPTPPASPAMSSHRRRRLEALCDDWARRRDDWQDALDRYDRSPPSGERRATSQEAYAHLVAEASAHIASLEAQLGLPACGACDDTGEISIGVNWIACPACGHPRQHHDDGNCPAVAA